MPRPRFFKLPVEKQDFILEQASHEFAEHGFEAASYNRIIDRAGLSKGAMYYYFDDKVDLYGAVLLRLNAEMFSDLGMPDLSADFWAGARAFYGRMTRYAIDHPEVVALSRSWFRLPPVVRDSEVIRSLMTELQTQLNGVLLEGRSRGAIRDDVPLELLGEVAFAAGEAMDSWLLRQVDSLDETELEGLLDILTDVFRRILEPRKE